jgi:hypothetical protein
MQALSDLYTATQKAGSLLNTIEPEQAAFELNAFLHLGNAQYALYRDRGYLDRARRSVNSYLTAAAVLTATQAKHHVTSPA